MWPFNSQESKEKDPVTKNEVKESVNIWYPLAGPPATPEQQNQLKDAMDKEHAEILKYFETASANKLQVEAEIERVAKENCADLTLDWRTCLKSLTKERFFTMCSKSHDAVTKCVSAQSNNLYRLGYHKEFLQSESQHRTYQLSRLADQADEMYLQMKNVL